MSPKSLSLPILASERTRGPVTCGAQVAAFLRVLRRIVDTFPPPPPPADHLPRHADKEAA